MNSQPRKTQDATRGRAVEHLHRRIQGAGESDTAWRIVTVVARLALAAAFLSAVADRLGLWGPFGTNTVAWGTFDAFVTYTGNLVPYLSGGPLRAAAVLATVAELALGLTLLLGVAVRWSAWLSAALLLVFGLSMAVFVHPENPLAFSVFSAMSASVMLAMAPRQAMVFTVD
ncbi:hypothetical protein ACFU99_21555, partial [Streptomyces sp. NPDC057654]